jgi:hypothetical protein
MKPEMEERDFFIMIDGPLRKFGADIMDYLMRPFPPFPDSRHHFIK